MCDLANWKSNSITIVDKDTGKDGPITLSPLKATVGKLPVISQPAEPIKISKKLKKGTDSEIMFTPVKPGPHTVEIFAGKDKIAEIVNSMKSVLSGSCSHLHSYHYR